MIAKVYFVRLCSFIIVVAQDDERHVEIEKAIDRVEVAPSTKDDVVFKLIESTFPKRHRAVRENDERIASLEQYLGQYPFMDNARCIDYEGIVALRTLTEGGQGWLTQGELHIRWVYVAAVMYALATLEELDVPSTWFSLFRNVSVKVHAILRISACSNECTLQEDETPADFAKRVAKSLQPSDSEVNRLIMDVLRTFSAATTFTKGSRPVSGLILSTLSRLSRKTTGSLRASSVRNARDATVRGKAATTNPRKDRPRIVGFYGA